MDQHNNDSLIKKLFRLYHPFTAFFLGALFFTAGMGKLYFQHNYWGMMGPVWLEEELAQYDLGLYARFIAYSQILIGFALLTQRFRTLGAMMLVPMLANILMVTISMNWTGTPYVVTVFILQNISILILDWKYFEPLFTAKPAQLPVLKRERSMRGNLVWASGLAVVYASVFISYQLPDAAKWISLLGIALGFLSVRADKENMIS